MMTSDVIYDRRIDDSWLDTLLDDRGRQGWITCNCGAFGGWIYS